MSGGENLSMSDEEKSSMGDGENPSMGDGEMSMADGEHRKDSVVPHFCRIEMIKQYVNGFTDSQIKSVHELGAGFVFSLGSNAALNPSLTKFVVPKVHCEKGTLEIEKGKFLPIRDSIKGLYNISDTGEELKHPGRHNFQAKDMVKLSKFEDLRNISIQDLWLKVKGASGADFCTLFMLALLNTFFAPSRTTKVNTSFLIDLMDHEKIKELDLCSFIAKFLINGIRAYQNRQTKAVPGCLHLLHLMCANYYRDKASSTDFPLSTQITDADLKRAAMLVSCASLENGKSADSVHLESMDSSPHNFRSKKDCARKAVTQKVSARVHKAEEFNDVTDKIMHTLKNYCDFETGDNRDVTTNDTGADVSRPVQSSRSQGSLGTAEEHFSPMHHAQSLDEDLGVMSSSAHDEDRQVTSSPVQEDVSGPVQSPRDDGSLRTAEEHSSSVHHTQSCYEDPSVRSSDAHDEDRQVTSSAVRVEEAAQPAKPAAKCRRRKKRPDVEPVPTPKPRKKERPSCFAQFALEKDKDYPSGTSEPKGKKTKSRMKKTNQKGTSKPKKGKKTKTIMKKTNKK